MAKQQNLEVLGVVTNDLSNSIFEVEMIDKDGDPTGHMIRCTISGKIRTRNIRICVGDKVTVRVSPYDLTQGFICYRTTDIRTGQGSSNGQNNKNKNRSNGKGKKH